MSKYSENMPPKLQDAIGWMLDDIREGSVFLDFGCSTGYFGAFIKRVKHAQVYGVEISDDVHAARKVLDGVYSFDLDGDWPAEIYERTYDYLFFGDVIEHLKDPQKVLEKCRRLLKKDGLIFISTPNIAHISIRLELMGGNFDYEPMGILDNTHLKYFTRSSLQALARAAGYSVKRLDFSANDYPNVTITKLLKKLGLTPQPKFWQLVDQPEARAFQHKMVLALPTSKIKLPPTIPSVQKPETIRNADLADLRQKVANLDRHAKEQAKLIEHYARENEQLRHKLRHPVRYVAKALSRRLSK